MRQTFCTLAFVAVLTAGVSAIAHAQYYQSAGQPGYNTAYPQTYGQPGYGNYYGSAYAAPSKAYGNGAYNTTPTQYRIGGTTASGTVNYPYGATMQPSYPLHEYGWGGGFAGYGTTLPSPYNDGGWSQTSPLDRGWSQSYGYGYAGYPR